MSQHFVKLDHLPHNTGRARLCGAATKLLWTAQAFWTGPVCGDDMWNMTCALVNRKQLRPRDRLTAAMHSSSNNTRDFLELCQQHAQRQSCSQKPHPLLGVALAGLGIMDVESSLSASMSYQNIIRHERSCYAWTIATRRFTHFHEAALEHLQFLYRLIRAAGHSSSFTFEIIDTIAPLLEALVNCVCLDHGRKPKALLDQGKSWSESSSRSVSSSLDMRSVIRPLFKISSAYTCCRLLSSVAFRKRLVGIEQWLIQRDVRTL